MAWSGRGCGQNEDTFKRNLDKKHRTWEEGRWEKSVKIDYQISSWPSGLFQQGVATWCRLGGSKGLDWPRVGVLQACGATGPRESFKGWSIKSKLSREEKREKLEGKGFKELEVLIRLQKRCSEKKWWVVVSNWNVETSELKQSHRTQIQSNANDIMRLMDTPED